MSKALKGGYAQIDLSSNTIYEDVKDAYTSGKFIIVYDEDENIPYVADGVSISGTSYVITKGGKTITIANDGTITSSGDVQQHLYLYEINMSDYSFNVLLPFKLIKNYEIETMDDVDDDFREDFKKLYDYFISFSSFAAYSNTSSTDAQMANIVKTSSSLTFNIYLVNYSDGSDESDTTVFNLTDGEITSLNTISYFRIDLKYQLF